MHPLRKTILEALIRSDFLNFSKLKPKDVEGNIFIYHLKSLISEGLVEKVDRKYQLTSQGQAFADSLNFKTLKRVQKPKALILLVHKNDQGKYLLYKRQGQPMRGLLGFPFFEVKAGVSIYQTFKDKLLEHFNLQANLTHRGDAYITTSLGEETLSYTFCHIIETKDVIGDMEFDTKLWSLEWIDLDSVNKKILIPGVFDIHNLLSETHKGRFFTELTYTI